MVDPRLIVVSLALNGIIVFYLLVRYLTDNERFAWHSFQTMLTDKYFLLLGGSWIIFTSLSMYYLFINF